MCIRDRHLYQVNHNVFIAHCKAVKALRELQPDAKFCGMNAVTNIYPYTNTPKNNLFAWQAYQYMNGFHCDVFAKGKYPDYMVAYLENRGWMPTFEEGDDELLKYTVDYIAFSYYRSNTAVSYTHLDVYKRQILEFRRIFDLKIIISF